MLRRTISALLMLGALVLPYQPARAAVYVPSSRLWPGGIVPFVWDADVPVANRLRVISAMNIWMGVANVQFVLRTNEADYVRIRNAPGDTGSRSAEVGRDGGVQDLFIRQDLSGITDYGLAHELGHVLGYYHTHQRPDRETYVHYYATRVNDCEAGNFSIVNSALGYPRHSMDFDSVMSYPQCTFSNCGLTFHGECSCGDTNCERWESNDCSSAGVVCCSEDPDSCRVLEIQDPDDAAQWQTLMGQRSHLSEIDAMTMSFLYPQSNWRFLELNYAGGNVGTFHDPYRTLSGAVSATPVESVLWIQPGTYSRPAGTITKRMTLRAPLGGVRVQ